MSGPRARRVTGGPAGRFRAPRPVREKFSEFQNSVSISVDRPTDTATMGDVTRTNDTERKGETMTRTEATRRNYEVGYRHGVTGREMVAGYAERYVGYADGWDHGHCDMPTWDERHPIDVAKERSTGCLD